MSAKTKDKTESLLNNAPKIYPTSCYKMKVLFMCTFKHLPTTVVLTHLVNDINKKSA